MIDHATRELLRANGYYNVRELSGGCIVGVQAMAFTAGLFVGLDGAGYERRYCYEKMGDALVALATWDGVGDPPGPWIKEKGGPEHDRLGPGAGEWIGPP